jgi:hypothetical protein
MENRCYNAISLNPAGQTLRAHRVIGIHALNGKIAYVHEGLGEEPPGGANRERGIPPLVMADWFSPDFADHTRVILTYRENGENTVLYGTLAESYTERGRLFLNTFKRTPARMKSDPSVFARIFEIDETSIRELPVTPEPEEKVYSDSKTYRFGDYELRMRSPFKMECTAAANGEPRWVLTLTAYLYTEPELRGGVLYFGTAGKGGRIYGVSLDDGRVLFSRDTGGTTRLVWWNGHILATDRKGELLLLNPMDGAEIKRMRFAKLEVFTGFPWLIDGDCAYTVAEGKNGLNALRITLGGQKGI